MSTCTQSNVANQVHATTILTQKASFHVAIKHSDASNKASGHTALHSYRPQPAHCASWVRTCRLLRPSQAMSQTPAGCGLQSMYMSQDKTCGPWLPGHSHSVTHIVTLYKNVFCLWVPRQHLTTGHTHTHWCHLGPVYSHHRVLKASVHRSMT